MSILFSIKNYQNATLSGIQTSENRLISLSLINAQDNYCYSIDNIRFIFSKNVIQSNEAAVETLERQVSLLRQNPDMHGFSVVLRKEGVYVVFDKSLVEAKEDGEYVGKSIFFFGCAVAVAGHALPAAMLWAAGSSAFYTSWKSDVLDYDPDETIKQTFIGAATALVTGGFQSLLSPAVTLSAQVVNSVKTGLLGYTTSEVLNGKRPTIAGAVTATLTGALTPIVSSNVSKMIPADQIDDIAIAILLKAGASGAASSATSKITQNLTSNKPWNEDIVINTLSGAVTGTLSSVPQLEANVARVARINQENKEWARINQENRALLDDAAIKKNEATANIQKAEQDIQRHKLSAARAQHEDVLKKRLAEGCFINDNWEHSDSKGLQGNTDKFLNKIANGERVSIKLPNWKVGVTLAISNDPAAIRYDGVKSTPEGANLKKSLDTGCWINDKREKSPSNDLEGSTDKFLRQAANGVAVSIKHTKKGPAVTLKVPASHANLANQIEYRNNLNAYIAEIDAVIADHPNRVLNAETTARVLNAETTAVPPRSLPAPKPTRTTSYVQATLADLNRALPVVAPPVVNGPPRMSGSVRRRRADLESDRDRIAAELRVCRAEIQALEGSERGATDRQLRSRIRNQIAAERVRLQELRTTLYQTISAIVQIT